MDVMVWCGWLVGLIVTVFTSLMLLTGASAARAPSWDVTMHEAGVQELAARGLGGLPRSLRDETLIADMLGAVPAMVDDDADSRLITAVRALTDVDDADVVQLRTLRADLLRAAVSRRHASVAAIRSPWLLVKVWQAQGLVSKVGATLVGLRWFTPPFVGRMRRIGEKYLSTATLAGVWLGFLYWGFTGMNDFRSGDWLSFVGVVVTLSCTVALVAAVGKQLSSVTRALWGRRLRRRDVVALVSASVVLVAFAALHSTGVLEAASAQANRWLADLADVADVGGALGGVLLLVLLGGVVVTALRMARSRTFTTIDRIELIAVAVFLATIGGLVLIFAAGLPGSWRAIAMAVSTITVVATVLCVAVTSAVSWLAAYRRLASAGRHVPRRGFRTWALGAWLSASSIVALLSHGASAAQIDALFPLANVLRGLMLTGTTALVALTSLPGVVITALYVHRVHRCAAELPRLSPVPAGPDDVGAPGHGAGPHVFLP